MKKLGVIAIDQYGQKIELSSKYPRKELLEKLGASNAQKMYVDDSKGESKHVGYIVAGCWFTFYNVSEWTGGGTINA